MCYAMRISNKILNYQMKEVNNFNFQLEILCLKKIIERQRDKKKEKKTEEAAHQNLCSNQKIDESVVIINISSISPVF